MLVMPNNNPRKLVNILDINPVRGWTVGRLFATIAVALQTSGPTNAFYDDLLADPTKMMLRMACSENIKKKKLKQGKFSCSLSQLKKKVNNPNFFRNKDINAAMLHMCKMCNVVNPQTKPIDYARNQYVNDVFGQTTMMKPD